MSKSILILIPKGLSTGIIQSQIEHLSKDVYEKYFDKVYLAVHFSDKDKLLFKDHQLVVYNKTQDLKKYVNKVTYFYFRSIWNYVSMFPFLCWRVKSIYDFRALVAFESWYRNKRLLHFILLFTLEGFAYYTATEVSSVSVSLKKRLKRYYLVNRKTKILPCLIDRVVNRENECLASDKRLQFVYVGGVSKWQCIEEIINWCNFIQDRMEADFTFITRDKDIMKTYLSKSNIKNYQVMSGTHSFVQEQLAKSDFGFLIREDVVLNKVASPVKFLEYTSNGVIPLITNFIGDYSKIVKKRDLGVILYYDKKASVNEIIKIVNKIGKYRKNLHDFSKKMTWDKFAEAEYLDLIGEILKN